MPSVRKMDQAAPPVENRGKPETPGGDHAGEGPGGRRVDPPGQTDNDHSQRPDVPPGQVVQTFEGTAEADNLTGGKGDDSLFGGAGDDTLSGGRGADELTGGDGDDTFLVSGSVRKPGDLDRILDFQDGDKLVFDGGAIAGEDNYSEATATDYGDALAQARERIEGGDEYVAVQVGEDVIVFSAESGQADIGSAVVLVGRTLTDVGLGDFG